MSADDEVSADAAAPSGGMPDAEPLALYLRRVGRLPLLQGWALAAQLLAQLDAFHRGGQVHAGVTSGQLLVTRTGRLALPEPAGATLAGTDGVTPTVAADGEAQAGQHRDLVGAAIVTYELLTGALPFASPRDGPKATDDPQGCDTRGDLPRPVRDARPELPGEVDTVFQRVLVPGHGEPIGTAAALLSALQAALPIACWERPPVIAARPRAAPASTSTELADPTEPVDPTAPIEPAAALPVVRAPLRPGHRARPGRRVALALAIACTAVAIGAVLAVSSRDGSSPASASGPADVESAAATRTMDAPPREAPAQLVLARSVPVTVPSPRPGPALAAAGASTEQAAQREVGRTPVPAARSAADAAPRQTPARAAPQRRQEEPRHSMRVAAAERHATRSALPASPDPVAACREDLATALCTAFRCATAEFRHHPVCVRMHAEGERARASLAESRGGP